MTSVVVFEFGSGNVAMENTLTKTGYSVSGMAFIFDIFDCDQSMFNKNTKAIAGIPSRQISVICYVAGSKSQIFVQYAENRQVSSLHPIHLPMHNCPVNSKSLYMTGLYCSSHSFEFHTLRYREVDISSWGSDIVIDHELGITMRLLGTKMPTGRLLPADAQLMGKNRMQYYDLNRLKSRGGMTAAQTPSSASAPDQLETLVGADTQPVTATNQSPHTVQEVDGSD